MSAPDGPFVHAAALCESASVGAGTRVWAFAHVLAGAVVGRDCNVCDHVFIEGGVVVGDRVTIKNNVLLWEGVTVEDDVFLGPNVVFTNDRNPRAAVKKSGDALHRTLVRRSATLGANVTVLCDVTIGEGAFVGAGGVVVADVPAYAVLVGNPARRIGWMCACGQRLPASLTCGCGAAYELVDEAVGLRLADEACDPAASGRRSSDRPPAGAPP